MFLRECCLGIDTSSFEKLPDFCMCVRKSAISFVTAEDDRIEDMKKNLVLGCFSNWIHLSKAIFSGSNPMKCKARSIGGSDLWSYHDNFFFL